MKTPRRQSIRLKASRIRVQPIRPHSDSDRLHSFRVRCTKQGKHLRKKYIKNKCISLMISLFFIL